MKANRKIVYFRYMDDIRLFAKNKHDLKLALIDLVKELRELKLNVNAKKTRLYETKDKESLRTVIDPSMRENRPHITSKFCWFFQSAAQF